MSAVCRVCSKRHGRTQTHVQTDSLATRLASLGARERGVHVEEHARVERRVLELAGRERAASPLGALPALVEALADIRQSDRAYGDC